VDAADDAVDTREDEESRSVLDFLLFLFRSWLLFNEVDRFGRFFDLVVASSLDTEVTLLVLLFSLLLLLLALSSFLLMFDDLDEFAGEATDDEEVSSCFEVFSLLLGVLFRRFAAYFFLRRDFSFISSSSCSCSSSCLSSSCSSWSCFLIVSSVSCCFSLSGSVTDSVLFLAELISSV